MVKVIRFFAALAVFAGIALPAFGRGTGEKNAGALSHGRGTGEKSARALSQKEKDRALLDAIYFCNLAGVRALLDGGANPNGNGLSVPLVQAAGNDFAEAAALLLERGAGPDARGEYGRTAAHHAAKRGNETMLRLLAGNGARLDIVDDSGETPLLVAAGYRYTSEVFRFILAWEREKTPGFSGNFSRRKDYIASLFAKDPIPPDMLEALLEAGEALDGDGGGGKRLAFYAAAASGETGPGVTRRLRDTWRRYHANWVFHPHLSGRRREKSSWFLRDFIWIVYNRI